MPNIEVKGTIVSNDDGWIYDFFGIENTTPKKIRDALAESDKPVTVEINSGGGDLFAGNEIYYMLHERGNVTVDIVGMAASAATIVACGGQKVRAIPGVQYMIHNVSCGAYGDYNEMDKTSEILQNANIAVSNIYQQKTGLSEDELLKLMNDESWFDAKRALELHFIDEIIGANKKRTLNNAFCQILSDEVKERIRSTVSNPEELKDLEIKQKQLTLLKLKGGLNK